MPGPNVYALQLDIAWEDKAANRTKIRSLIERARPHPGSMVVLPEMSLTGFSLNLEKTRQGSEGEDDRFFSEVAREFEVVLVGGVVSPAGEVGCNEAVVYSPTGELLARYRKIHPFSLGGETAVHSSGREIATF